MNLEELSVIKVEAGQHLVLRLGQDGYTREALAKVQVDIKRILGCEVVILAPGMSLEVVDVPRA